MAELEPLGEGPDRRWLVVGESFHLKEQLVLLRLDPRSAGREFPRAQESTELIPELRQGLVVDCRRSLPTWRSARHGIAVVLVYRPPIGDGDAIPMIACDATGAGPDPGHPSRDRHPMAPERSRDFLADRRIRVRGGGGERRRGGWFTQHAECARGGSPDRRGRGRAGEDPGAPESPGRRQRVAEHPRLGGAPLPPGRSAPPSTGPRRSSPLPCRAPSPRECVPSNPERQANRPAGPRLPDPAAPKQPSDLGQIGGRTSGVIGSRAGEHPDLHQ